MLVAAFLLDGHCFDCDGIGREVSDFRAATEGALHQIILAPGQVVTLPDGTKGFHGYSRVFLDNYEYSLISMRLCVPWDPKDVMQIAMSWDMEVP